MACTALRVRDSLERMLIDSTQLKPILRLVFGDLDDIHTMRMLDTLSRPHSPLLPLLSSMPSNVSTSNSPERAID